MREIIEYRTPLMKTSPSTTSWPSSPLSTTSPCGISGLQCSTCPIPP
jgi:hypothetical protein